MLGQIQLLALPDISRNPRNLGDVVHRHPRRSPQRQPELRSPSLRRRTHRTGERGVEPVSPVGEDQARHHPQGDALLALRRWQTDAARAHACGGRGLRWRHRRGHAAGLRGGVHPHLLADPRRPAGDGQRRLPPRKADEPQGLRRRDRRAGGRRAVDPGLRDRRAMPHLEALRYADGGAGNRQSIRFAPAHRRAGGGSGGRGETAFEEGAGIHPRAEDLRIAPCGWAA